MTDDARRGDRDRRALVSTVALVAARVVGLSLSFVAIPLTIGYLGAEQYGVFAALTALTSMFMFADLGLSNGLMNLVSGAHGKDDRETAARAVSSAFFMLALIATAFAIALIVVYPLVDWANLLGAKSAAARAQAGPAAAVLLTLFAVALPLSAFERVRLAYQEGFVNAIAAMAGSIVGLVALILAIAAGSSLPVLIGALSIPPILALAANVYELIRRRRPWLLPRARLVAKHMTVRLARLGFLFLVLQLAVVVAYQSDVLVAASVLGAQAAATYAVTLKVFLLVPSLIGIYLSTLWPAYTEALSRQDATWIRRTLRRSIWVALAASVIASLALVIGGSWLIRTWTGGAIDPPLQLLVGAAVWAVLSSCFNAIAMLLNAGSVVAFQVILAAVMAIASVTFSVILATRVGLAGIIWGTVIAYILFSAIPFVFFWRRIEERLGISGASLRASVAEGHPGA